MAEPPPLICPVVVPLFVTRSVTSDKPCFSAQWFQVWDSASCSLRVVSPLQLASKNPRISSLTP